MKSSKVTRQPKAEDWFDFSQACAFLGHSPVDLAVLRKSGLITAHIVDGGQVYSKGSLEITKRLLEIGASHGWSAATTAWYADLLFASNVGRAILLPLYQTSFQNANVSANWLETTYAVTVLEKLIEGPARCDEAVLTPLSSLLALGIGKDQFWTNETSLIKSDLYPIVKYFETKGQINLDTQDAFARDVSTNFAMILFAFIIIAPPISAEFMSLVEMARWTLKGFEAPIYAASEEEQSFIIRQALVPVDKLYASKTTEIHSPAERWNFRLGVLRSDRRTIAVQMKLPPDTDDILVDNILDMIRPFLGPFGARVIQLLYEVSNDPPYYRHPVITIDTNEFLDHLGLKRDPRGIHRSKNRERLRDSLNAAHNLEIVGEYTTWEDGKQVRKTFYRTVLSITGATFDAAETASLSTAELRTRGLPKSIQLKLNFYDGIRRPDGKLGNQYILVPRLSSSHKIPNATYSATEELLRVYFLFRYRQTPTKTRTINVTRQMALENANITNKNARMATITLRKALDRLISDNTLDSYSVPLPTRLADSFEITLSEIIISGYID